MDRCALRNTVQSNRVDAGRTGLNDVWQRRGAQDTSAPGGSRLDKQGSAPIKLPSADKLWSDTNGQIRAQAAVVNI